MRGEGWPAFARTPKSWFVVNSLPELMTENILAAAVFYVVHGFLFSAEVSVLFVVITASLYRLHSTRKLNLCYLKYCTRYACRRKREARHDSAKTSVAVPLL